jgi:exopolysaccharide biosynthesis polyprenyl glycosylphosphotransferase
LVGKGIGIHRILLIGNNRTATTLADAITKHPTLGLRIVEQASEINDAVFAKLKRIVQIKQLDEVIAADPNLTRAQAAQLIEFCKTHHLQFKYAADLFDAQIRNMTIRPIAGIPVVEVHNTPLQGWGRIIKRMIDIILSIVLLIICSPILLIVALLLKFDSSGPIIYRNQRVGENGKLFDTLKFRSMYQQYCIGEQFHTTQEALKIEQELIKQKSIKVGPLYKIKDDPRVTTMGQFVRATSIDELPQLLNVLKGEMSLVGPRPHQPREVQHYADHHRVVLGMKPGMTGLAQISGRSDLEFEEEVRLDTYYMENWHIMLDWYILFKTPFILFNKRKAL